MWFILIARCNEVVKDLGQLITSDQGFVIHASDAWAVDGSSVK